MSRDILGRGSVLMETLLVMPILAMFVFAIVQFVLIWYAKIMTQYAAYNAARAALVYHPGEYREVDEKGGVGEKFLKTRRENDDKINPCWSAACRTLAWVSFSPDANGGSKLAIPGLYNDGIPYSSHIENQVRIVQNESHEWKEGVPFVRVTVEFDFPVLVPVIGKILAYFNKMDESQSQPVTVANTFGNLTETPHKTMNADFVTLSATAILTKPYKTSHFPRTPHANAASGSGQTGGEP